MFLPVTVPLWSSGLVQMGLWWPNGLCGGPGSSMAGRYLGSPSHHCVSELLFGHADEFYHIT